MEFESPCGGVYIT